VSDVADVALFWFCFCDHVMYCAVVICVKVMLELVSYDECCECVALSELFSG